MLMEALRGSWSFVRDNPFALVQAARNAARFELSVPIDLLRWGIERRPKGRGPERIELFAADPAIGVALTVDLYGTKIDVSAQIAIESIENFESAFKIALRVRDLGVKAPPQSPAAMMLGALDLSRPGNLVKMMPGNHAVLVDASDDRFVLDLRKIPALAKSERFVRALAALSFIRIKSVRAEASLLAIGLDVSPRAMIASLRAAFG